MENKKITKKEVDKAYEACDKAREARDNAWNAWEKACEVREKAQNKYCELKYKFDEYGK